MIQDPTDRGDVLTVVQEDLRVERRDVQSGRVVVHTTVTEHDETIDVALRQDELVVERVPIGRVVTEVPETRREGDVLIVPVLEEVLVVEKRLVLTEELHIRTKTTERIAQQTVRLRTEHVDIQQTGPAAQDAPPVIKETSQ